MARNQKTTNAGATPGFEQALWHAARSPAGCEGDFPGDAVALR